MTAKIYLVRDKIINHEEDKKDMKKRMSRIIAIMLVLLMVVCNQSYSSMASDTDNSISEEAKTLSGENEAGYTEVATDSHEGCC